MNFVLILNVTCLLGSQVERLSKKLDICFWTSGEKGQSHIEKCVGYHMQGN